MTMGHIFGFSPGLLPVYFLVFMLIYPVLAQEGLKHHGIQLNKTFLGQDAVLNCTVHPITATIQWQFNGTTFNATTNSTDRIKITESLNNDKGLKESTLAISKTTKADHGEYTCVASLNDQNENRTALLDLTFRARFVNSSAPQHVNATRTDRERSVTLTCVFEMYYEPDKVEWTHPRQTVRTGNFTVNGTRIESKFTIDAVAYKDHGIHQCSVYDKVTSENVTGNASLIVYSDPTAHLENVIGISSDKLFVNWTINPANSQIQSIYMWLSKENGGFQSITEKINSNATSYVIKNLTPNTTYTVKLNVKTDHGDNEKQPPPQMTGTTLVEDPVFVPNISINGFSATSVTIGWHAPPKEVEQYIHYYLLEARKKDGGTPRKAYHNRDSRNLPYMFDNLEPHSTYIFKVRACQDYTRECGNWSEEMEAATLDGVPGKPSNVRINCTSSLVHIFWDAPEKPNAEIKGYTMELTGQAEYRDRTGHIKKETWGPLSRFKSNDSTSARFDDLQPNTNYTIRVSAMTRTRRRGEEATAHCRTKAALPDTPPRPRWRKILDRDRYLFKMFLPKVSERNGPICCYRVHVVRLPPHMDMRRLPAQAQLDVIDYEEAHGAQPLLGAYITDVFTNDNFPAESEIVIGDGHQIFNRTVPPLMDPACDRCLRRPQRPLVETPAPKLATTPTTTEDVPIDSTEDPDEENRERRSIDAGMDYKQSPVMQDSPKESHERDVIKVTDGFLDSQANYTVFVELIPYKIEGQLMDPMYSEYLNQLMPAPSPVMPVPTTPLEIALQVTCAVAAVVLLIMIIFCIMQTRRSRKLPPHAHLEMSRLPPVFRFLWPTLGGRQQLVSARPPDMPPIAREDLPAAYAERHADSDLGFQKEFELLQMLSECFPDRTTHASEARENQSKNRYPDIKAYDQTRVKLSQIDGITGSDYINANYVMGYKERKKFICAQGPTDTTVNDFWRMIWEHGLELIVMLTNLEEYSKVKCSKYWPDEVRGSRAFGSITVHHVSEKRYSDYIVRELKITKQPTNADGQPIVENNGVAKRNGDIKQESSDTSAPTSPREVKDSGGEARIVRQYHFLMWKDFAAPEHPYSILKFIKRVNEAWSNMVGRPVVVHCSAGVGRTGTLVALDCLLEQLRATGQAAVFNTIAELRRQRNFLVQSQKQYVFVYRALVEYAHYGDTEIPACRLKSSIDRLRNTPEGQDKCLMEHEFEKMIDHPVAEAIKSCAAGQADELRNKNRNQECLPYDRNRVMLTPIPGRDYSTYINASFVEAYDNTEGFIITQDPLPNTIFDFWRMVSEQSVSTIVMLSELGEGKCPRYWDDGTAQYEHISVQYDESESCPYYTRRQFRVTNNKTGHTSSVVQLQYQGWPTAPGHVPEVTRGLAELADAAQAAAVETEPAQPMLVHCSLGTERSALFVALCILICQLRTERRVDVNAVARKVRSQRAHTIDTLLQYEFLHRAILNYAELHNLLEDS